MFTINILGKLLKFRLDELISSAFCYETDFMSSVTREIGCNILLSYLDNVFVSFTEVISRDGLDLGTLVLSECM